LLGGIELLVGEAEEIREGHRVLEYRATDADGEPVRCALGFERRVVDGSSDAFGDSF